MTPEGTTEPRECLDDAEATVVDGWCVHVGFRHVGPCPPAPAAEDDAVAAWQARAEQIIDERTAERDEARQQVARLRAALDDERAARRIAGEAADRFRDVLADCLGHDDENPGDDVLVAEVRTHFGRTGPEPTRWRDFLTGARARLDQIEAMPDPLRTLAGSGEQPGPLKAGVMALTGLSSDEVDALGGVREEGEQPGEWCGHDVNALVDVDLDGHAVCSECEPSLSDRPAPVVPDSTGLRQAVYRALDDTRGWHPSAADQRLIVLNRMTEAVLAAVRSDEQDCNCGFGGQHDPANPRCRVNDPSEAWLTGQGAGRWVST